MDAAFWVVDLMVPVLVFIIGIGFYHAGPTDINGVVGYRTRRSRSSQEAWDFAQQEMAKWLIIMSLISGVVVVVDKIIAPLSPEWLSMINLNFEMILLIFIVPIIESKLKKKFDKP
ncbi:MAG: SdpI family protein [Bacillota bacterium]|jgi:uncharacterized membrane protein